MRSRCSAVGVSFVITVVALTSCLVVGEMMEESGEQSDTQHSDFGLKEGNDEGESFRLEHTYTAHKLTLRVNDLKSEVNYFPVVVVFVFKMVVEPEI